MACDLIQGKKGAGKSKLAVMWIRDALLNGRQVCTNLDLFLDKLMPPDSRAVVLRIPDKPTAESLAAIGPGNPCDRYNPDFDGLLVLDELGGWLNARTFNDPQRMPVINWLIHSRKHGWETVFLCQDAIQIDRQVRETQIDYVTRCLVADKITIPVLGWILAALFGPKAGRLPKFHIATRRMGTDPRGMVGGSWWYRTGGPTIQAGYDTLQIFSDDYPHGAHSLLSAWHLVGRHLPERVPFWRRVFRSPKRAKPAPKPKLPQVAEVMALPPDARIPALRQLAQGSH